MNAVWQLSATGIAEAVGKRDISVADVARASLERLAAVNPLINAVVECRPDEVMQQARLLDSRHDDDRRGPLFGVPVTIKVNTDQAGYATTNGLRLQKDLIAASNSPVVESLLAAGALILGRTNVPAFSYRWFTANKLHGHTRNPHDPALTPGGSSGGAASAVAAGIGAIAHGTDIAGSIRYPAYACGVHGLRPTPGRVAAYNASSPERPIGAQITSVSGPIARTIDDLRLALRAMARPDPRDPWWVPAPLDGPAAPAVAALCVAPAALRVVPEVQQAVRTAGESLRRAGWTVEEVENLPPLREPSSLQTKLWLMDGYEGLLEKALKEGDEGALAVLRGHERTARELTLNSFSDILRRRASMIREWNLFLDRYPVVVMPVSAELPFPDHLDLRDEASFERVWEAQIPQIAIPFLGLPALSVSTGLAGDTPVGVQVVSRRFREDLCLLAGQDIEAARAPILPIDPR